MNRSLMIDIGAGTMDILYLSHDPELVYKAVVKSPAKLLAEKARVLEGPIAVTGVEMGGSPISGVLKEKARLAEVVLSHSAAATIHHHTERVASAGFRLTDDADVQSLQRAGTHHALNLTDLEIARIRNIVEGFGVPFEFDAVAVCAQDHGVPPQGVSHLDFRHRLFREALDKDPHPHALLYRDDEVPDHFSRLTAIAACARQLNAREIYVMDSGMAAILGSCMDIRCAPLDRLLVLDIATSHTVGAAIEGGELVGFFEYHTHAVTAEKIETLLRKLSEGDLSHEEVLAEGGHGAYIRRHFGFDRAELILATGPKRRMMTQSNLPIIFGAPLGDHMMTGTVGLQEALRRRKGLPSLTYI